MPEAWTGKLVGKMHVNGISCEEVAEELNVTKAYVSMILNSRRKPDGIRERMEAAVQTIVDKRKANA